MNKQEQNIAIAKACGYTQGVGMHGLEWWTNGEGVHDEPPDYVNSLNSMHEAEKIIHAKNYAQLCVVYRDYLNEFMERDRSHINAQGLGGYHATAAQRAEAFLRTLNLWKE